LPWIQIKFSFGIHIMAGGERDRPDPSNIVTGKRAHKPTQRDDGDKHTPPSSPGTDQPRLKKKKWGPSKKGKSSTHEVPDSSDSSNGDIQILDKPTTSKHTTATSRPTTDSDSRPSTPPVLSKSKLQPTKATKAKYEHRLTLAGRPNVNCAADHEKWKISDSLAYTFLVVKNTELDERTGKLAKCELHCAWCNKTKPGHTMPWTWTTKGGGSTSNFTRHFRAHHQGVWEQAE